MSKPNAIMQGDAALDELLDAAHSFTKADRERLYLVNRMVKRVLAREAATTRELRQARIDLGELECDTRDRDDLAQAISAEAS